MIRNLTTISVAVIYNLLSAPKAKFDTGTVTFEMVSPDLAEIDYNRLRLLSTEIGLGDTAYVEYKVQTTNDTAGREKNDLKTILPGDTLDFSKTIFIIYRNIYIWFNFI